jgi:hypothetical protein
MSDSIFSHVPTSTDFNPRAPQRCGSALAPATLRTPPTVACRIHRRCGAARVLQAPLALGTTARDGFLRKEAELRAAFAALPVATQRAMHARLSNPRADDELAARFHQLTAERRARLLNLLADARRREALAAAR